LQVDIFGAFAPVAVEKFCEITNRNIFKRKIFKSHIRRAHTGNNNVRISEEGWADRLSIIPIKVK